MSSLYVVILFSLPVCQSIMLQPRTGKGDDVYVERSRRSTQLADIGNAAARLILKGAERLNTQKNGFTMYMKKGTRLTAFREFRAAVDDPNRIMRYRNLFGERGVFGAGGDRLIHYTPRDIHAGNKPTITIHDAKRAWSGNSEKVVDKVIYE